MNRDRSLESRVADYLGLYGNCAQSSFRALHEHLGLEGDPTLLVRALQLLPGVGLTFETCGAVSGCLLALGLSLGEGGKDSLPSRIELAREFCLAVRDELGSTRCGEIMERQNGRRFDLLDPIQMKQYVETGASRKCGEVVQTVVGIAARLSEGRPCRKP